MPPVIITNYDGQKGYLTSGEAFPLHVIEKDDVKYLVNFDAGSRAYMITEEKEDKTALAIPIEDSDLIEILEGEYYQRLEELHKAGRI